MEGEDVVHALHEPALPAHCAVVLQPDHAIVVPEGSTPAPTMVLLRVAPPAKLAQFVEMAARPGPATAHEAGKP